MTAALDRLEQLLAEATPGPWERGDDVTIRDWAGEILAETYDSESDAALIVALRNAAPELIQVARQAQEIASGYEDDDEPSYEEWRLLLAALAALDRVLL